MPAIPCFFETTVTSVWFAFCHSCLVQEAMQMSSELAERQVGVRADGEHLVPDGISMQRFAEVVRDLLADRIPVRLGDRLVLLIIIPERTGMHPHQLRDRYMLSPVRQKNTSLEPGVAGHI
jgi:hypothetical protein